MPHKGWLVEIEGEWRRYSHEEMLQYAAEYPEGFDYTPEMIVGMYEPYERTYVSPTMLLDCTRKVVLKRHLDYDEPLDYVWTRFRGKLAHFIMENAPNETDAVLEVKREVPLHPWGIYTTFRGTPDKVVPGQRLLIDYKTVSDLQSKPKDNWTPQLSMYRWMLAQDGITIDRAFIQQIGMKAPRRTEIELWPLAQTEEFIIEAAREKVKAFDGTYDLENLPPQQEPGSPHYWMCMARRDGKPSWCPVRNQCFAYAARGK